MISIIKRTHINRKVQGSECLKLVISRSQISTNDDYYNHYKQHNSSYKSNYDEHHFSVFDRQIPNLTKNINYIIIMKTRFVCDDLSEYLFGCSFNNTENYNKQP